jgi:adenylate cyclase
MQNLLERVRAALAPIYQVEGELGEGGMGRVFRARNTELNRWEAIKVIKPELATAVAVERFRREAQILASIEHPNIVGVYGAGEAAGLFYYAMAYVRGETLATRLERGPLSLDEAGRLASDVLDALEAAHACGVIHRDLKPSNILTVEGRTKVVDFGLARSPAQDPLTATDATPGTLGYMAPEQWSGGTITLRTDLYAAGAVFYEALTGSRWKPTESDWSDVPPALMPVLQRALAWLPDERWPDARTFRDAFVAAASARQTVAVTQPPRLAAIMFTDMVGYTSLVQADVEGARKARARIRVGVEGAVARHDGEVIQYFGDGCLSIFSSAAEAVFAAFEVQDALRIPPALELRVGIDQGEIRFDEQGIYGDAVNVAARLQTIAYPGSVVVSGKVFEEIRNRRTIGTTDLGPRRLKNVIRPVRAYVVAPASETVLIASPKGASERTVAVVRALSRRLRHWLAVPGFRPALAVIVALVLLFTALFSDIIPRPLRVIAVVPQTASGSGADAYITAGLAEGIHNQLRRRTTLQVINNASSSLYRDSTAGARRIGRQLGADALVFIRASASERDVRLSVQLVRVRDGVAIWDTLPTVRRADLFVLVDELSPAIAQALEVQLTPAPVLRSGGTRNAFAQEFYWEAREMWRRRTPDALRQALQLFQSALERDSAFALAHVGLADTYNLLGSFEYGVLRPDTAAAAARDAANRALRLVPEFPPALAALGNVRMNFDWEWVSAEEDFRRAIALDPGFADAREWLAMLLLARGQFSAADSMLQHAKRNNSKSPLMFINVAQFHYLQGDFAGAYENIEDALALDANFSRAHAFRAFVQSNDGRASEAVPTLEAAMAAYSGEDPMLAALLGNAYARAGRREDALGQLDWLEQLGKGRYIPREWLAMIHLGLGDAEAALDRLEEAADLQSTGMIYLNVEPMLAPLREHPRFKQLVQRVHPQLVQRVHPH